MEKITNASATFYGFILFSLLMCSSFCRTFSRFANDNRKLLINDMNKCFLLIKPYIKYYLMIRLNHK